MRILLSFAFAFLVVHFLGYGVTRLLLRKLPVKPAVFAPIMGYGLSLVIFFHAYFLFGSVRAGSISVFLLAGLPSLYALWLGWRSATTKDGDVDRKDWFAVGALALLVVAFAAGPYLYSGWGGHWLAGTPDIEDALNGRDAYVKWLFHTHPAVDLSEVTGDATRKSFEEATGVDLLRKKGGLYSQWFAEDEFRFQYSSVAFWSDVLLAPTRLDALIIQALLNLLLMAQGVYWLARLRFGMSSRGAFTAAGFSVLGNFYLATYFNGHEGSMMYGAFAPFVLLLVIKWIEEAKGSMPLWAALGLLLYTLANTYPQPLAFLLPPIVLYGFHIRFPRPWGVWSRLGERWSRFVPGILAAVLMAVAFWLFWGIFEPYRIFAADHYRAWGIANTRMILPIFWGVVPSLAAGGLSYLPWVVNNPWLYNGLVSVGFLLFAVLVVYAARAWFAKGERFWIFYLCGWAGMGLILRFFVTDPYFFYKLLYTNQFVLVIGLVSALGFLASARNQGIKVLGIGAAAVYLMGNLISDAVFAYDIAHRDFNQETPRYQAVQTLPPQVMKHTFINLSGGQQMAIRQLIKEKGVAPEGDPREAQYFLGLREGEWDVTDENIARLPVIWTGDRFALRPAPKQNQVWVRTWFQPEEAQYSEGAFAGVPFRWVGHRKNDAVAVYISRLDPVSAKYLRFCAEPGPSIDNRPFGLKLYDARAREQGSFWVAGVTCHWIPLERLNPLEQPYVFRSNLVGRSLLPLEDRILNFRVARIGVTSEVYDLLGLKLLNGSTDIVSPEASQILHSGMIPPPGTVYLGNNWFNFEKYGGASFRWVANQAELVVYNPIGPTQEVVLETQAGPGLGKPSGLLRVLDGQGRVVTSLPLGTRQAARVALPVVAGQPNIFRLSVESVSHPVPNDPRVLNFRVFRIEAAS